MRFIFWMFKSFYLKVKSIRVFFLERHRLFFYYILPNAYTLFERRLFAMSWPRAYQKVLCEGKGKVRIGYKCTFGYRLGGFNRCGAIELQARYSNAIIKIGDNVTTNNNVFICAANYIEVGDHTLIGQYVTMMDFEAHGVDPSMRRQLGEIGKIVIGKNVWIGNNIVILKNTFIGDNTIVAAGAVVSGIFPSNVIIGGVPAKIIRSL